MGPTNDMIEIDQQGDFFAPAKWWDFTQPTNLRIIIIWPMTSRALGVLMWNSQLATAKKHIWLIEYFIQYVFSSSGFSLSYNRSGSEKMLKHVETQAK